VNATHYEIARRRVDDAFRALIRAQKACDKTCAARAALPAGSSRAKVTTANARWMSACEERYRREQALRDLGVDLAIVWTMSGIGGAA
jgi:hypothetical protein